MADPGKVPLLEQQIDNGKLWLYGFPNFIMFEFLKRLFQPSQAALHRRNHWVLVFDRVSGCCQGDYREILAHCGECEVSIEASSELGISPEEVMARMPVRVSKGKECPGTEGYVG